jgi:hypothetical protein
MYVFVFIFILFFTRSEAFRTTECNRIFSVDQPQENWVREHDCMCGFTSDDTAIQETKMCCTCSSDVVTRTAYRTFVKIPLGKRTVQHEKTFLQVFHSDFSIWPRHATFYNVHKVAHQEKRLFVRMMMMIMMTTIIIIIIIISVTTALMSAGRR